MAYLPGTNWASEASPTLGCSIEISRDIYIYSQTSEQRTLWDQYKFKWILPGTEVVLFKRFQLHYIDRGIKFGDLVLSIVERYIIHCPFIGGSSLRGSTVCACVCRMSN